MPTVNERLADEAVAHGEALQRYSNSVVRRIVALLNRADADLAQALFDAIERLQPSQFNVERIDSLLTSVRSLIAQSFGAVAADLAEEARKLVEYEAGHQFDLFDSVLPPQVRVQIGIAQISVEQAYAAALARPFQGRLLREWISGIETQRAARVRDAVRIGFVEQQTVAEIVMRVRGRRAKGYADGLLEIDRKAAEAVVRTAVSHFAGFTRDRFLEANSELAAVVVWTSTLDTRTSEICRVRDGKRYGNTEAHKPIGHSLPWLGGPGMAHWMCRSTAVPVVASWQALGIEDPDADTRASMDGQVSADTTFAQWLKRQSAERQDDVLGPTRGRLFRDGGLALDRFYNDKGRYLTLDELRARDAAAFKRAGV